MLPAENEALEPSHPNGRLIKPSSEDSLRISFARPLGIVSSTERIHFVLHVVQQKVFSKVKFPDADFGSANVQHKHASASKSALLFFATFFCRGKRK